MRQSATLARTFVNSEVNWFVQSSPFVLLWTYAMKFTGPIEAQRHPHLLDGANQEAAWQAVVNVSGVNWSYAESLRAVPEGAAVAATKISR